MTDTGGYTVTVRSRGRIGEVVYREGDGALTFPWEFVAEGVSVWAPAREWPGTGAPWAAGRRDAILRRIAAEVRRQQAPDAEVAIDDRGIHVRLGGR